jgi:hypothetical protein
MSRAGRELELLIRPLGLWRRRGAALRRLSAAWRPGADVRSLPGVGRYGADAHAAFVGDRLDVRTSDGELNKYIRWRRLTSKS